jgi:acetyl-CoA C-acetyltransferase
MKDVVIVSACRTAIGAFGGTLKDSHAATIASATMKAAVERAGIDAGLINDVRYGCCMEPVDTLNVTRIAALLAGIPDSVPAVTVNRVCISGMSGAPYSLPGARWGYRLQDQPCVDNLIRGLHCGSHIIPHPEDGPVDAEKPPLSFFKGKPYIMGHTAEFVAQHLNISREEMDAVALRSHNNAERATKDGAFKAEIIPLKIPQRKKEPIIFERDEHFRPGLTMADLQKLPPAFVPQIGKVTAGNSSGINDGSAALIIMSADRAKELHLQPLARIRAAGKGACHPSVMGLSPVPAVKDLFKRSGLQLNDFDLIEINEAFAAQYLGCEKQLGLNREITNINGSGIGLGHPVGATGARIIVTLIHALKQKNKSLGLATLCGGGGVSMACAIELL